MLATWLHEAFGRSVQPVLILELICSLDSFYLLLEKTKTKPKQYHLFSTPGYCKGICFLLGECCSVHSYVALFYLFHVKIFSVLSECLYFL